MYSYDGMQAGVWRKPNSTLRLLLWRCQLLLKEYISVLLLPADTTSIGAPTVKGMCLGKQTVGTSWHMLLIHSCWAILLAVQSILSWEMYIWTHLTYWSTILVPDITSAIDMQGLFSISIYSEMVIDSSSCRFKRLSPLFVNLKSVLLYSGSRKLFWDSLAVLY